jgi:hypothetical protein
LQEEARIQEEAALANEYLEGTPKLNIGALLVPPLWGPAKGIWATILWYPFWVFADNCLFAWWSTGTVLATVVGVLTLIITIAVTVAFAYFSRPYAAIRAIRQGKSKEEFQRGEVRWAIIGAIVAVLLLTLATYYNLCVRVPLVA